MQLNESFFFSQHHYGSFEGKGEIKQITEINGDPVCQDSASKFEVSK